MVLLNGSPTGYHVVFFPLKLLEPIIKSRKSENYMATSELEVFADDSAALAMKRIFSQEIYHLDIADGLKQLLYEKKYDLNSLLRSNTGARKGK